MKVNQRRGILVSLSLLALITSIRADLDSGLSGHSLSDRGSHVAEVLDAPRVITEKSSVRGTDHAPVDGKDGLPKAGPWVETSADRERKKGKGSDDEDENLNPQKFDKYKSGLKGQEVPQSNEGVMDDKGRSSPVEGTRGTEGGISEKSKGKDNTYSDIKKPETPKEAPPLPHSEKERIKGTDADEDEAPLLDDENKKPISKPTDLPEAPHAIPRPENPSSPKDKSISQPSNPELNQKIEKEDIVQPLHSTFMAFLMILGCEIGDKTFLVACLMAMRHDRLLVFSAAFSALVAMTVLSAILGHAVPTLIPKWLTNFLASGLFLAFGIKMLIEARGISPDEGVSEEMKEVEQELEEKEHEALRRSRRRSSISPYILESGRGGVRKSRSDTGRLPSPPESPTSETSSRSASPSRRSTVQNISAGVNNLCSLLLSPAWVQTFVMTFLGEWGDRSQIATIAMAAGSDYWWVTIGALGGHAICTGVAVLGGKAIAGRVSLRTVTMAGAFAFLLFGVIYLLEAIY